jgi:hypothetical protein
MRNLLIASAAVLLSAVPASAQDARFKMEQTEHGIVRLDRQTGEMSTCRDEQGELVCRPASDGRIASVDEIDMLRQRVDDLERRVAALETMPPPRPPRDVTGERSLPSEEEFERSMGFMEKFFRRFMGMIREFEQEEAGKDQPNRT